VLNEWARGFKDRDGKFVKEFQTTFDSSFWELYLFAVMKHFELEVDFSLNSPDFVIANHGRINVEATVASHPQGSIPESVQSGAPIPDDLNEFNRQTIIRISNSFDAKRRKCNESYSELPHVQNRPFVLAVSAFDRPFAWLTCQRAIEALLFGYYVNEERFLREGGTLIESMPSAEITSYNPAKKVCNPCEPIRADRNVVSSFRDPDFRSNQSPGHHTPTTFSLGPLVRKICSDHIFHGNAHSLIHGDLDFAEAAWLPAKSHCSKSRSYGGIQASEFAATNRSRLKSVWSLNKEVMLSG